MVFINLQKITKLVYNVINSPHSTWQRFGIFVLKIFCLPYHPQCSFFRSMLLLLLLLLLLLVVVVVVVIIVIVVAAAAAATVVVVVIVFTSTTVCCKQWLPI